MKRVPFVEIDGAPYAGWWRDRFAPRRDPFDAMRFYRRGRSNIWVGTADVRGLEGTRLDAVGIHLLRIGRRLWKPTSTAIRIFGGCATINAIELDTDELGVFLAGSDLELAESDVRREMLDRGFVAVRYHGVAVGCGEWRDSGVLASLLPKSERVPAIDV